METAFQALKAVWRKNIDHGIRAREPFIKDAEECMRFFDGPYGFMYGQGDKSGSFIYTGAKRIPRPSILVTINKVAEGVQLFGPSLYNRNPICNVNPRQPPVIPLDVFGDMSNPQVQQQVQPILANLNQQKMRDAVRAALLGGYLNYLPTAIGLKNESRMVIDETMIKGGGALWPRIANPAGGSKTPILEFTPINDLLIDPDYQRLSEARWIARRFCKPIWEVEVEHGMEPGTLKGTHLSSQWESATETMRKKEGKSNDLLVYFGIWSKMGMGGLLKGVSNDAYEVDQYGQYVYVEICDSYPYFLNVPQSLWDNDEYRDDPFVKERIDEEIRRRVQWETPFWCDVPSTDGWPFELLAFHKNPDKLWPVGHFKPGLGLLQFINWGYSFLISGIQKRSRDFIAIAKSQAEEIKEKILEGDDLTLLEISSLNGNIDNFCKFLQHPTMNEDSYRVLEDVMKEWEKSSGVTELMYGMQATQDRSAEATKVKQGNINIRPDDMANTVEDWMTNCFRKLALMGRWHMTGQDIGKIFGPVIGQLWDQYVATADIDEITNQLEYRIESGSAAQAEQVEGPGRGAADDEPPVPVLVELRRQQRPVRAGQRPDRLLGSGLRP